MNYKEAMEYIGSVQKFGSVLGLEGMKMLLKLLGNPEKNLKIIHVAGTNGKGSTAAFISTILAQAGYRVGRYLSPAIFGYRERIQRQTAEGSRYIAREAAAMRVEQVKMAAEAMLAAGFPHPTPFELETAMAFLEFSKDCDMAVVEVGLGGRLDATNAIEASELSVLTSISMDHMQVLGDTLEKITGEKAGIIKRGGRVAAYDQRREAPAVTRVIEEACREKGASLSMASFDEIRNLCYSLEETVFDYKEERALSIKLLGECQVRNAVTAIEAIRVLMESGYSIKPEHVREGLWKTRWPGRFEIVKYRPLLIADGAHNEDAAKMLADSINRYLGQRSLIYIVGVLADKDYRSVLRHTMPYAGTVIAIAPDNPRALPAEALMRAAEEINREVNQGGAHIMNGNTAREAMGLAEGLLEENGAILAFGSLSFLGELYRI